MFTGLVKEIGVVTSVLENKEGRELTFKSRKLIANIRIDDSVSVNGVCQTAIKVTDTEFKVQAIHTTLEKTNFGELKINDQVNLELSLTLQDRLGGHFVQGHVDDVGVITNIKKIGKNYLITTKIPDSLMIYTVSEGSIALDGISLTISNKNSLTNEITVSIIPHTLDNTVFKYRKIGDKINLEVDILSKYVANMLNINSNNKGMTQEWIESKGF